jgi:hypothetical protein
MNFFNSHFVERMREIAPHRDVSLFDEFLPRGYSMTTLDAVPESMRRHVLETKMCLGTLITLVDDLADHPKHANAPVLRILSQLHRTEKLRVRDRSLSLRDIEILELALDLVEKFYLGVGALPHGEHLKPIMEFDFEQILLANRFAGLMGKIEGLPNAMENILYFHHNMGMVLAGMIDYAALPGVIPRELGSARTVFVLGQRFGRLCNVLTTLDREIREGDRTNEVCLRLRGRTRSEVESRLRAEMQMLLMKIKEISPQITSFSVPAFIDGLKGLYVLHQELKGRI